MPQRTLFQIQTLAALTGPPIHEQLVAIGDDIVQKQAEVPEHCASEPNVVENIDATPEKPVLLKHAMKQGVKRFAEKADELTPAGKSDKKTKKNMPEGCGGVTAKALSCVICERPQGDGPERPGVPNMPKHHEVFP